MGVRVEGETDTAPPSVEAEQPESAVREEDCDEAEAVLDRLDSRLAEAQRLLARQAGLTERLHAENQVLRAGELRSAQAPLIRDLIRLSDDMERMRAAGDGSAEDLALVHESLLDVLARNGVEAFEPEQGEPFDSGAHAAAAAESTEDEQLDRTVAEVVRRGFRWDSGEVIRVAEVRAYRFLDSG
jgi:molecular chaperone GrpE (heat shock protein)